MCFLFVACDDAMGYQGADSHLHRSSLGLFLPLAARLQTHIHDYDFLHLINSTLFNDAAAYRAFQQLAEVDWTLRKTDERWFYCIFRWASVHAVPTERVRMRKLNADGNIIR